ncbi:MAG: hypothetical protein B7Z77_11670 [Acidocella sp. 20-58-15]|nr:MAG: hypothetical protein B7Z77_11670 [Acidocella sp. 20-58-15]
MCSLYECNEFAEAQALVAADVKLAVLTRSEAGSVIVQDVNVIEVEAVPVNVVDTTGAGDAYAAGFMTAYAQGRSVHEAGKLGSRAAALAISQIGARPSVDLLRGLVG